MIKGWIVAGQTAQENLCPPESTTRPRLSELVQIDGSPHDWFEGRAGRCNLTVFIAVRRAHRADGATSRLLALHFSPTETTQAYMETLNQ